MKPQQALETILLSACERAIGWRAASPTPAQLAAATIVAHRGERDGQHVIENTLAAFDPVVAAGVGAIEFDIRYTRDDEPVVHHDATLARTFGLDIAIADLTWRDLRARAPQVPHLADLVARYGRSTPLMVELKERGRAAGEARLHRSLADLTPIRDYRFLSLRPALFAAAAPAPADACIPVAKLNWPEIRAWANAHACGGIAGAFVRMPQRDVDRLRDQGAFIGSGFLTRGDAMCHEIARGVSWLFTNQPLALQRMLDEAREAVDSA